MRATDLNLRHLRAFSAVIRHQSISLAATKVFLSQPALSQAIAKLETQLGTPMFERQSSGMIVTQTGHIFANRVDRAMAYIFEGSKRAAQLGAQKKGFNKFDHLLTAGQLRALIAMEETGNFSLAARKTSVSQPTLHRAARDLERLSGIAFFNKTSLGINLTRAATALAKNARLALYELDQGIAEVRTNLGINSGRMVIGTMPLARTYILPTAINAFAKQCPEIDISVIDAPYHDLLHGLRHGAIDCMIGALRDPLPMDDVSQELLLHDSLVVVSGPDHPLLQKTDITLADMAAFPWVVPRKDTPTRDYFETLFKTCQPDHIIESSSLLLIRGLLENSPRLTLISAHQIIFEERQGYLKRLSFNTQGSSRPIGMTLRKDWQPTATQTQALNFIRAACQDINSI